MLSIRGFSYLKEFVYGGIDGSVTTFAIVAGATGANMNSAIVIVLGFANLIADGFSMSVGNYLSTKSELASDHQFQPINNRKSPTQTAIATFCSFLIMGLIPLLGYVVSYLTPIKSDYLFAISCFLTSLAFLFIGFLRGFLTGTSSLKSIAETLFLGIIAAILAYFVGSTLQNIL